MGVSHESALGSAFVNFAFNTSTALFFAFLIVPFERLVKKIVPIKNQQDDTLLTEELQRHMSHPAYTSPLAIALRKDTRNFIREVINVTHTWIQQRLLRQLVNEPLDENYDATLTEKCIGKSEKLLRIANRLERKSKNTETREIIEQCKL